MQWWHFIDNLVWLSYWAGNCWEKNIDMLWTKQICHRIMSWKGAQKSPSSCPAYIPLPKQLLSSATCCYSYCYCEVIICFKAHLFPGKKSAIVLSLVPLSYSVSISHAPDSQLGEAEIIITLCFTPMCSDHKRQTHYSLWYLTSIIALSSYLFCTAWYKAKLCIFHVSQMEFGRK